MPLLPTIDIASGLFQRALERVLVLAGESITCADLGLGDLVAEDTAHADAALVDVEHHPRRILDVHLEELWRTSTTNSIGV
jgi:hypothetical protein